MTDQNYVVRAVCTVVMFLLWDSIVLSAWDCDLRFFCFMCMRLWLEIVLFYLPEIVTWDCVVLSAWDCVVLSAWDCDLRLCCFICLRLLPLWKLKGFRRRISWQTCWVPPPSLAPNPALARVTQNASFPIFQIAFVLKIEGGNFSTSPRIHVQNWNGIFQRQDLRREMILNVSSNF